MWETTLILEDVLYVWDLSAIRENLPNSPESPPRNYCLFKILYTEKAGPNPLDPQKGPRLDHTQRRDHRLKCRLRARKAMGANHWYGVGLIDIVQVGTVGFGF